MTRRPRSLSTRLAAAWTALRFRLPKDRAAALAADWGLLLLLSYCTYYLINYWYRALNNVSPVYRVPFPDYAYVVAAAATLFLAILWENLGTSIGWKSVGLNHADRANQPLRFLPRTAHFALDLASWSLTAIAAALALAPLAGLGTLLYGIVSGSGIMVVPSIVLGPLGPWYVALGWTMAVVLALVAFGYACWWTARALLGWLWPGRRGTTPWADRVVRSQVCKSADVVCSGPPRPWWRTSWGLMTLLLVGVGVYVGWLTAQVNLATLIRRASSTGDYWQKLVTPDFKYFLVPEPDLHDTMLNGIIQTIFMALLATLLGFVFALPFSFLGARNMVTKNRLGWGVYTVTRAFFNIGRSIEPFVMAVLFATTLGYGPFAGCLALLVHTVAALGKLYSEQIEAIDPGPVEAITACGGGRTQILRYGVVPQVVPPFLAFTLYRWDINVRMATIIGMVGGGGIGRFFNYFKNELRWHEVGAVIVIIAIVVWIMDYISGRVRERIT
ncbi:MAG: phosphonate ABC transporter, permease protein PhnE [Candidatus Bipolaricaulis sp.]|nr:phosphonate ABC transporter, permease protein PhnE [Candidatus Bipolaricaulis sp.]